jgi:hypothetical protein
MNNKLGFRRANGIDLVAYTWDKPTAFCTQDGVQPGTAEYTPIPVPTKKHT